MYRIIYIFMLSFWAAGASIMAQDTVRISKAMVRVKVAENNTALKISEEDVKQARADYRQTQAVFLPTITASHTAMATTNPLLAFGSKLNQEILTQSDFNPALLNAPSQIENFATRLEIQQPLLHVDGIYRRKAAKSKMEATALQKQRQAAYLNFEAEKAYLQLQLAYKGIEVLEKTLEAARANKQQAENRYAQGYLQKADVLAVDVRVTEIENQLLNAKSNVENASNYLSFLMNDTGYVLYEPAEAMEVSTFAEPLETAVPDTRSDIKAMQLASSAYESAYKASKMAFLPRLNAFGSYELHDDQLFQGQANGYTFGAQLSWNIFEGSKRFGEAQKSKSEYEKSKLEASQYLSQSQLELNKAMRMLHNAENGLRLTQLALQQSEESLRIRLNRFKEGLEQTSDLLWAEANYAQKQLEYYQTLYQLNYAQAYIQFLTKE